MKTIGVIPSRLQATRFPEKPLALIKGKPLVRWVVEGVLKAKKLDEVVLATDSERIASVVKDLPCRVVFTDPNLPSGSDRAYAAVKDSRPDFVINIQGDEPLIQPEIIDSMVIRLQSEQNPDMVTVAQGITSTEELNSPNIVKVILDSNSNAIYFSRFPIPYSKTIPVATKASNFACLKHIGLYGFRYQFLESYCQTEPAQIEKAESLEQLRALFLGARIQVIESKLFFQGIDVPEDIQRVESWLDSSHAIK